MTDGQTSNVNEMLTESRLIYQAVCAYTGRTNEAFKYAMLDLSMTTWQRKMKCYFLLAVRLSVVHPSSGKQHTFAVVWSCNFFTSHIKTQTGKRYRHILYSISCTPLWEYTQETGLVIDSLSSEENKDRTRYIVSTSQWDIIFMQKSLVGSIAYLHSRSTQDCW